MVYDKDECHEREKDDERGYRTQRVVEEGEEEDSATVGRG